MWSCLPRMRTWGLRCLSLTPALQTAGAASSRAFGMAARSSPSHPAHPSVATAAGQSFWDRWDRTRLRAFYNEAEMRSGLEWRTIDGERIPVRTPGRFTMKEVLEFTRRKAAAVQSDLQAQEKAAQEAKGSQGPSITQERDMEMARMPLLNIFRNPTCKYHVPFVPGVDDQIIQERAEEQEDHHSEISSGHSLRSDEDVGGDDMDDLPPLVANQ